MSARPRHGRAALTALLALAAAVVVCAPSAHAKRRKPYWGVSFVGGVMQPVGTTADARQLGLGVGLRVGYTTRIGLGLTLVAEYSPLPLSDSAVGGEDTDGDGEPNAVGDNHLGTFAAAPRFTLGGGTYRLWLGAGGGAVVERTRIKRAVDGMEMDVLTEEDAFEWAALGEVGFETHFWDSGGLVISGGYLRSLGDREMEIATVLGGLVFTFR